MFHLWILIDAVFIAGVDDFMKLLEIQWYTCITTSSIRSSRRIRFSTYSLSSYNKRYFTQHWPNNC